MKVVSRKRNDPMESKIQKQSVEVDTGDLPSFDDCKTILDMSLWILWVAKDKMGLRRLSAQQISLVLRDAHEVSIRTKSITQALKRAGRMIHIHKENGENLYEIMKAGKDRLLSLKGEGTLEVFYFEPGQKYSSKRLLSTGILNALSGQLRIADPYCGERTLDIIKDVENRPIKFLTKMENIRDEKARNKFLRELKDFKTEYVNIEFRDYPNTDLHDRYVISPNCVVLLGYSIKDLGAKESFAIVLNEASCKNIYEALSENFDRRWKQSNIL